MMIIINFYLVQLQSVNALYDFNCFKFVAQHMDTSGDFSMCVW